MTLSPSEDRRSEGIDGPLYDLNLICPVPGCGTGAGLERHHMWRRSDIGGDKWWVRSSDERLHGNVVKLCASHHRELSENRSRIVYSKEEQLFLWEDAAKESAPLTWQPPGEEKFNRLSSKSEAKPSPELALVERLGAEHVLGGGHDPEVCPTCLRRLPRPKQERGIEERKVRKTWSIAVPLERYEDGAEVLDTLLAEAHLQLSRNGLPYGEGKTVRYYILSTALGLFVTHASSLMSDE